MSDLSISVIAPMYNEEAVLKLFFEALIPVLDRLTKDYEIICINDGSVDNTYKILDQWRQENPRIKIINFTRNFGKEAAITAGMDHSKGEVVIPMDADLQGLPRADSRPGLKMESGLRDGFGPPIGSKK